MERGREESAEKSRLRHVWIIRTTCGRIACISGTMEEVEKYAKSLVEGTDSAYELIA